MAPPTKRKSGLISHGIASQNRKARYDYTIKETIEAGIVLKGPEVKSLRHGRATLTEAWAGERDGEMFLFNCYIPEYQGGVLGAIARDGYTLVPLEIRFNDRGLAKVELGLGLGRNKADKRHAVAARDWQRDKSRLMREKG
jgi:SsrA-binding protein